MKIKILLILIMAMCACSSWKKEKEARHTILLDKFDIEKFEELQKAKQNFCFLKDSTKVTLMESNSEYQENRKIYKSHFSSNKLYFKDTKTLKYNGEYFQEFRIGIHKNYDKKGRLKNEFNYDSIFTFSLSDLAGKLKRDFSIDINGIRPTIAVNRVNHIKPPFYQISFTVKDPTRRTILINGINVDILMDTTYIQYSEK